MRALAHRIRYSGVPFQHRVLLCGSLIMSKILHGIEVNDLNTQARKNVQVRPCVFDFDENGQSERITLYLTSEGAFLRSSTSSLCQEVETASIV